MPAEQSRARRPRDETEPHAPTDRVDEPVAAGPSAAAVDELDELDELEQLERLRARLVRKFH